MKPFNLERAIAGDPLVFKSGQTPYDITWHPATRRFVGQIHRQSYFYSWDEQGVMKQAAEKPIDHYDLMMAPRTVTKWILFDSDPSCRGPFNTKEDAEDYKSRHAGFGHLTVAKIEYEE